MRIAILIVCCAALVCGCSNRSAKDAQIAKLEKRIDQLQTNVDLLESHMNSFFTNTMEAIYQDHAEIGSMGNRITQQSIQEAQANAMPTNPPLQKISTAARKPALQSSQDILKANLRVVLRNELINQQLSGNFRIFQHIEDGLLIYMPSGALGLAVGAVNESGRVDGEVIHATFYRCGSYTYSTTGHSQNTVRKYTVNIEDALNYYIDKIPLNGPVVLP